MKLIHYPRINETATVIKTSRLKNSHLITFQSVRRASFSLEPHYCDQSNIGNQRGWQHYGSSPPNECALSQSFPLASAEEQRQQ